MEKLIVKDLVVAAELDRKAMAAVHGGTGKGMYSYWNPVYRTPSVDFSFDATQSLQQSQNTLVNNGNNAAFVSGITSTVTPHQTGANTINFG